MTMLLGMMMMVSAGDLIALYVGLELQSLALYVLAALRRMVAEGAHVSPQLLLSRLTRDGAARPVLTAVLDLTTSGAATEAARRPQAEGRPSDTPSLSHPLG
jgi:NADH:ubiquinone oxidoreductase subunit 5 (subunit L)/multisubunit Na+/H+ antiporter MnhA subunit